MSQYQSESNKTLWETRRTRRNKMCRDVSIWISTKIYRRSFLEIELNQFLSLVSNISSTKKRRRKRKRFAFRRTRLTSFRFDDSSSKSINSTVERMPFGFKIDSSLSLPEMVKVGFVRSFRFCDNFKRNKIKEAKPNKKKQRSIFTQKWSEAMWKFSKRTSYPISLFFGC